MARLSKQHNEPIAVVGCACRLPGGVSSPSELWNLLSTPRDLLSEIPASRFEADKFYHPDSSHHGTSNVRHSYFLSQDHRAFDADFFGIKPAEATAMDPQQRILLETSYDAFTSAGYTVDQIRGSRTGVFVGLMSGDYADAVGRDLGNIPVYFAPGISRSIVSNRLSYTFDLRGPSMTIDTACSSSLVALHQAVLSLRDGDSSCALVAGTNLLLSPDQYVASSKLKMLSPSGRSRMWDKDADGYGRGEGVVALVLKRLSQALEDNDVIEGIIRETGVNQDGRTKGITEPSALAQASLIRETYDKACLDLGNPSDRPQYFEAHGTGTPTGDPIEAEAISTAFFNTFTLKNSPRQASLLVGSIKTVIGHTEGTAGVAGVLKAILSLRHSVVPPNLLFNELNPDIAPFYNHVEVPTEARPWPCVPEGAPRRASVNSFGFGGTNAHAIIELYDAKIHNPIVQKCGRSIGLLKTPVVGTTSHPGAEGALLTPFVFSAATAKSLIESLHEHAEFLRHNPSVNLRDLNWTLCARRTTLPVRVSVYASTVHELLARLDLLCRDPSLAGISGPAGNLHSAKEPRRPRILALFTGQGAQWPAMGSALVQASDTFQKTMRCLQSSLDSLPRSHAPAWRLLDELAKEGDASRLHEASLSQPITTAIQIGLVDLLASAGICYGAVVGHSSGEIAAAYAAGFVSAGDAIRIAYYRGLFVTASTARRGAMLAVGTTYQDARELCELPSMKGRIQIAAINSPSSITLSGDVDAIQEAEEIFDDENKFARALKVDRAYHSFHMADCVDKYVHALDACGLHREREMIGGNETLPVWISSVTGEEMVPSAFQCAGSAYWGDNMVKPVLFSSALERAFSSQTSFDVVIEIGPSAALKVPALSTIKAICGAELPYLGTLRRHHDDIESFADALGSLWKAFGSGAVDFASFEKSNSSGAHTTASLVRDLPGYRWNHDRIYWHTSRFCEASRRHPGKPDILIGVRTPESTDRHVLFKNRLFAREISWLRSHRIQGEMVFPASGYIAAGLRAVQSIFPGEDLHLVEFSDVAFRKALIIPSSETAGVDTMVSVHLESESSERVVASFSFASAPDDELNLLTENMSGRLIIVRGARKLAPLPVPDLPDGDGFLELEAERFYTAVEELGHGYSESFAGLHNLNRKQGEAMGCITIPDQDVDEEGMTHPAILDCAIQSLLLAYCYPGDGQMTSLHMPTKISHLTVDLEAIRGQHVQTTGASLQFYSTVVSDEPSHLDSVDIVGDVEVWNHTIGRTIFQLQGLRATPLITPSSENDVTLFFETRWGPELPCPSPVRWEDNDEFSAEHAVSLLAERVSYFYLRRLVSQFPPADRNSLQWYHVRLLEFADNCLSLVRDGKHPYVRREYDSDSEHTIAELHRRYPASIDMRTIKAVGEGLAPAIRGESNILETMMRDNLLTEYYSSSAGMGAGVGAATEKIFDSIGGSFASYMYTDISSSFFQAAKSKFANYSNRMNFQVLDIEQAVSSQGFAEYSFDLVIGSLVLHATSSLESTLRELRKLLKPGGFMIILEVTNNDATRPGLLFGALPGWWLGVNEGRQFSPCVSAEKWERLFIETGFSAIRALTPDSYKFAMPLAVIVCQAMESRIQALAEPFALTQRQDFRPFEPLTVIGRGTDLSRILHLASPHYRRVSFVESLDDPVLLSSLEAGTVVCLPRLQPTGSQLWDMPAAGHLEALQHVMKLSRSVLFVTQGARCANPHANLVKGMMRSVALEMPDTFIQTLDFEVSNSSEEVDAEIIALKLIQLDHWRCLISFQQEGSILWCREPEMLVRGSQLLIPRIYPSRERNQRYNSIRRPIQKTVEPTSSHSLVVHVQQLGTKVAEHEGPRDILSPGIRSVRLDYSCLGALRTSRRSPVYLSTGTDTGTGQKLIVISDQLKSIVQIPVDWTVEQPAEANPQQCRSALVFIHTHMSASRILSEVTDGKPLVVINPCIFLARALVSLANQRKIPLSLLVTDRKLEGCGYAWTYVHPRASRKQLCRLLPRGPAVVIDMSAQGPALPALRSCLPVQCPNDADSSFSHDCMVSKLDQSEVLDMSHSLRSGWASFRAMAPVHHIDDGLYPIITLPHVSSHSPSQDKAGNTILSWECSQPLMVSIQSAGLRTNFSPDRTYWLVGLTGGLGQSLCQWMAKHGARYIALSSRNPTVNEAWLQSLESEGCTVRVFSSDVTNRAETMDTYRSITSSMPPVAGIAQGAMVLHDAAFPDLTIDSFQKVLRPKVDGTRHLDHLFGSDTLDFFVCFSSLAYVVGNRGQSSYTAANAFMTSLMAQRRARGLAGSVIHIGGIFGEGYLARQLSLQKQRVLRQGGFSFISLEAFFELFAEGILSSRLLSGLDDLAGDDGEVSAGLRVDEENFSATFADNPIFQAVVQRSRAPGTSGSHSTGKIFAYNSIMAQLKDARREDDLVRIIQIGFLMKLRSALQMALDDESVWSKSPDELGVDSLVAVDLQSWFRKELSIEIPTMKILSAATLQQLLDVAKTMLSLEATPNLQSTLEQDQIIKPEAGPLHRHTEGQMPTTDLLVPASPLADPRGLLSSSAAMTNVSDATESDLETEPSSALMTVSHVPDTHTHRSSPSEKRGSFERVVPLSFAQSGFWFFDSLVADSSVFNVITVLKLEGSVEVTRLQNAVLLIGYRHQALRTAIFTAEASKGHFQGVMPNSPLCLEVEGLASQQQVDDAVEEMRSHRFDLQRGNSVRLKILSLSDKRHFLILGYHHIVMDGVGHGIFLSHLERAYSDPRGDLQTDPPMLQYPDFTVRQRDAYERGLWHQQIKYWQHQFADNPRPLSLLGMAKSRIRPPSISQRVHSAKCELGRSLKARIRDLGKAFGVSVDQIYLTVYGALLLRYQESPDPELCIGVADSNRKQADVLQSLGLFLNVLPLRLKYEPGHIFSSVLGLTRTTYANARANSDVPFSVLLDELRLRRSLSHHPLFQAFFNYRPNVHDAGSLFGCQAEGQSISTGQHFYDVGIDILDRPEKGNIVQISLNSDLYVEDDAQVLLKSYVSLLEAFGTNPAYKLASAPLHSRQDTQKAIELGQGPCALSSWPATLVDRIDEMTWAYPDRISLTNGRGQSLTYRQMDSRIQQICSLLRSRDSQSHEQRGLSVIAVLQTQGIDRVCSFLAVLRSGSTCVPLDPSSGEGRLLEMLRSCRASVVLVDDTISAKRNFLEETGAAIIDVSPVSRTFLQINARPGVTNRAKPDGTAVISYTSGSSGSPKGVPISHEAYRNYAEFWAPRWRFRQGEETLLQQSSISFDMAISQIFIGLAYGATLVIPGEQERNDPAAIFDLILSSAVTFTIATPTEYMSWLRYCDSSSLARCKWRSAASGGEPLSQHLVRAFGVMQYADFQLINVYGPTECTFGCADSLVPLKPLGSELDDPTFPALAPMPNYAVYILDNENRPVPTGVPGRVAIGGAGVSQGYLLQATQEPTSGCFIKDDHAPPFFQDHGWTIMHVTEDRGRLTSEGRLVLEGRMQDSTMVKLGGVRIDLQDIEKTIVRTLAPSIQQAVVSVRGTTLPQTPYLVAFVTVGEIEGVLDVEQYLYERSKSLPLPQYMCPSIFATLEDIPRTMANKIDRAAIQALPLRQKPAQGRGSDGLDELNAPHDIASTLSAIWVEILPQTVQGKGDCIPPDSDFFHIGGNSLSMIGLQALIRERLGLSVPIHLLMRASSFREMAELLWRHRQGAVDRYLSDDIFASAPDWDEEIAVTADLGDKTRRRENAAARPKAVKTVIITGATGFLGQHVLQQLVDDSRIVRVHCLAVRRPKAELSPAELYSHSKVSLHSGDLTKPALGLEDGTARAVFDEADVVVHAGCDTSFLKSYQSLRAANFGSTKELVKLSLVHGVPIHFVSTAAVGQLWDKEVLGPHSTAASYPSAEAAGLHGYLATKWVNEVFLERLSARFGLRVVIHRPSSITGPGAPESDLMSNLLKYARLTKTVPDTTSLGGVLDFISVEAVAGTIVKEVLETEMASEQGGGSSNISFLHEAGEVVIELGCLQEHIAGSIGEMPRVLPLQEWIDGLVEVGLHQLFAAYLGRLATQKTFLPRILANT
ncbi:hypothetical protein F5Y17DRAFT_463603 [Xylariaceae sp. FL0594]|nr:hypothetical protein F5Y17DRAFT_463603 [Xylariaceae sp. FL0594]